MPGSLAKVRQHLLSSSASPTHSHQASSYTPPIFVNSTFRPRSTSQPFALQPSLTAASDPPLPSSLFSQRLRRISPSALHPTPVSQLTQLRASTEPSPQKQHAPLVSISQVPAGNGSVGREEGLSGSGERGVDDVILDVEVIDGDLIVSCELPRFALCTLELIVNFTELICIDVDRWELDARSPTYSFWDGSRFNDQDIRRLIQRTDLPILFQRKSTEQLQAPLKIARRTAFDCETLVEMDVSRSFAQYEAGSTLRITIPHA